MEQTLGKRIMQHRKKLKLTQDQLAEQLGVTAQAVSKWENDQSCPDIAMLPKLASIFGITADQLLGSAPEEKVHEAEVVTEHEDSDSDGIHVQNGNFELSYNSGKKGALSFAIFICALGLQLFAAKLWNVDISFWSILWPSALVTFGIFGLVSKFSFFQLGCLLFGTYFLLDNWNVLPFQLGGEFVFPALILLFGFSLLADALKKPHKPQFRVFHKDNSGKMKNDFEIKGNRFEYNASFGEAEQFVSLPCLSGGKISTSFGDYTVDLSGVQQVSESCLIDASCSFGELTLLVPKQYTVRPSSSTAFAEVSTSGHPDSECKGIIAVKAHANFGEISIRYI